LKKSKINSKVDIRTLKNVRFFKHVFQKLYLIEVLFSKFVIKLCKKDDFMAERERQFQLVTFQLGEEQYGIDIMDVKEIVRLQEIRPIPNAPVYVEGIINLRREIIPIINLHKRFHIKKPVLSEDEEILSGFIIIDLDGMKLGIIIDRVARVVTVEEDQIQEPPQMLSGIGAEYIQGVVPNEQGYLIILDIRRIFNIKELQRIQEGTSKSYSVSKS
jgi:purine-binding chemotaxis protein CheW